MINQLFNENVTYYDMFLLADKAKTILERERDSLSEKYGERGLPESDALFYKRKLQSLYRIRNNSFVLLLRNGIKCTRENEDDPIIKINVDGIEHVCKESVLKTILQKEYDIVLANALSKENPKKLTEQSANPVEEKETIKAEPKMVEPRITPEPIEEPKPESVTEPELVSQEQKREVPLESNSKEEQKIPFGLTRFPHTEDGTETEVELKEPTEDEFTKTSNQFIMDIYKIHVKDIENKKLFGKKEEPELKERDIILKVIPLSIPESGNSISSDILVYMECENGSGTFFSGKRKTIIATDQKQSFLVTGTWENGKFSTRVRATNDTLTQKAELGRELIRIRPTEKAGSGIGHPVLFVKDGEKQILRIHCIPIEEFNGPDGFAPAVYCMEEIGKNNRFTYRTKEENHVVFKYQDDIYKLSAKWDDNNIDAFKVNIENA